MDDSSSHQVTCTSNNDGDNMLLTKYKIFKIIGHGSYAMVKLGQHVLTGHSVAIKILNRVKMKKLNVEERVGIEIAIMRLLTHTHIIQLYEVISTSTDIYLVMEYAKCGELLDHIMPKGKLQDDVAHGFFQQIILGVEYCHRNKIAHRDLKPDNLLLDASKCVKIADFGLSNVCLDGTHLKTPCGSPHYAAPEVLSEKPYGLEVDIWSCGVILYGLLCGRLPFDEENDDLLHKKIKNGIYILPRHLSPGARDLITKMLVVDPKRRITILQILEHPWFQVHLSRFLVVPSTEKRQLAHKIVGETMQRVARMGFDRNQLIESLGNRTQNDATVAFLLLLNRRLHVSNGYIGDLCQLTMEVSHNFMHAGRNLPWNMNYQAMGSKSEFTDGTKLALRLQPSAHPDEIMIEVLSALIELNVHWMKIDHYKMKCVWIRGIHGHQAGMINNPMHSNHIYGDELTFLETMPPNVLKFEVELYKASEEKYVLDVRREQGPQHLFLILSEAFLAQLCLRILKHEKVMLLSI